MNGLFDAERVYSLSEIAGLLRVSRVTLLRAAHRGELKAFRVGNQWRVLGRDVLRYVNPRRASETFRQ